MDKNWPIWWDITELQQLQEFSNLLPKTPLSHATCSMFIVVWTLTWPRNLNLLLGSVMAEHCSMAGVCTAQGTPVSGSGLDTGLSLSDLNISGEQHSNHPRKGQDPGVRFSRSLIISTVLILQLNSLSSAGQQMWLSPARLHPQGNTEIFAWRGWLAWNQRLGCSCPACRVLSRQAKIPLDAALPSVTVCWVWQ